MQVDSSYNGFVQNINLFLSICFLSIKERSFSNLHELSNKILKLFLNNSGLYLQMHFKHNPLYEINNYKTFKNFFFA